MKTDSYHILCVNPWIHDFAAFDFWARPLGLLSLAAVLREKGFKISFIDCLDRFHPKETIGEKTGWDGRGPYRKTQIDLPDGLLDVDRKFSRYGIKPEWFRQDLVQIPRPDLVLVTSMMTYWASGVKQTIDVIKDVYPDVPVVLGGVYASLCHDHAKNYTKADCVIQGPGETVLPDLIEKYSGGIRMGKIDPSENLENFPFPAFDLQRKIPYVPILTSRGCPFSCDYCASSFLEPKLRRRPPNHVFDEISHWHQKFGVKNFAFYDDALLVNAEEHAFVLFEKIIRSGMDLFFHTPNAVHIREITQKAADLMAQCGFKTIRMGLETTDFGKERAHDVKVKEDEFSNAVRHLKQAGFESSQIGAYLLCGLPDQNLDDVEKSMDLVRQTGIIPVLAFYTPIPHTRMWDDAVEKAKYDLLKHPVFTNNTLFPCVRPKADLSRISQLKNIVG